MEPSTWPLCCKQEGCTVRFHLSIVLKAQAHQLLGIFDEDRGLFYRQLEHVTADTNYREYDLAFPLKAISVGSMISLRLIPSLLKRFRSILMYRRSSPGALRRLCEAPSIMFLCSEALTQKQPFIRAGT